MKAMQVIKFVTNYINNMETIGKETQTNEEILIVLIEDFFDCRRLPQHLIFLDHWMHKVLVNKQQRKYLKASDLLFFSAKFSNLLAACYQWQHTKSKDQVHFEEAIKIPERFIDEEQKALTHYPYYLRKKEICNPMLVLHSIFKEYPIDYYTITLQNWIEKGLSTDNESDIILPTYKNLKRMIEACWLIHERLISKNSYKLLTKNNSNYHFAYTCPLLLSDDHQKDPYLFVESFFSFAGINEYREDLTKWFKVAINEQQAYENASDLLFLHNQITQLIQAGYLISTSELVYNPLKNYTKQHDTFGHWLLARLKNQYHVQTLSPHFKANPLQFCIDNLTLNHIVKLRYGLNEWLEAALSKNSSITSLDYAYIFDQFEELQKIVEALFLIIIQPALAD